MAIYSGNHLPEAPTSMFQLIVSVAYTLLVVLLLGYGAVAVLAAQEVIGTELQAAQYMQRLVRKHNTVLRGFLAFIPATYSLGHLYTSSLHNGTLYSASNVFYAAIFAFATSYLGGALKEVVKDSAHMNTTKAVYEVLYFLCRCRAKLSSAPKEFWLQPGQFSDPTKQLNMDCFDSKDHSEAWKSPWVLFNCFLSIAALDDARIWGQFLAWIRRRRRPSTLDFVPPPSSNPLKRTWSRLCAAFGCYWPRGCKGYAYWLFEQDDRVYRYTGSVIVEQNIPEKLSIAGRSTRELFLTAHCFLAAFAVHFQAAVAAAELDFSLICSAGNARVTTSSLKDCLCRVNFQNQGLNMAVERYMCRSTPDYAALSLPGPQVVEDIRRWIRELFGKPSTANAAAASAADTAAASAADTAAASAADTAATSAGGATPESMGGSQAADPEGTVAAILADPSKGAFYCTLWLAYIHMALLGMDCLRLHNNKAVFSDYKQHQAGFFEIMRPEEDETAGAAGGTSSAAGVAAGDAARGVAGGPAGGAAGNAASDAAGGAAGLAAGSAAEGAAPTRRSSAVGSLTIKAAADGSVKAVRKPPDSLEFPELHMLSFGDQHSIAALLATVLLVQFMQYTGDSRLWFQPTKQEVDIPWVRKARAVEVDEDSDQSVASSSYLRNRSQLVYSHSSLPAIVQGVECRPQADWVCSLMTPLGVAVACVALVAVTFATISCTHGVYLVAISGFAQAYAAWGLLLHMEQVPVVKSVGAVPRWSRGEFGLLELLVKLVKLAGMLIWPAVSIIEVAVELLLAYSPTSVRRVFWLATSWPAKDAREQWLRARAPYITQLGDSSASSSPASRLPGGSGGGRESSQGSGGKVGASSVAASARQHTSKAPKASSAMAGSCSRDTQRNDQGSPVPDVESQRQQQPQQQPQPEQPTDGAAGHLFAALLAAAAQLSQQAAACVQAVLGWCQALPRWQQRLQWAYWLVLTLKARRLAGHLVRDHDGPDGVALAAAVAAEAVAIEGCVAAVSGAAGDSVDVVLDEQLNNVQAAVEEASNCVWEAEGQYIANACTQQGLPGPAEPHWKCPAVEAAVKAKSAAAKAAAEAAAAASAAADADAAASAAHTNKAVGSVRCSLEQVLFFLGLLKAQGVSLGSCFNLRCRRLYKSRIRMADVLTHGCILTAVLSFMMFIIAARVMEPYYARGSGMCLGRCGGMRDCQTNITLQLPLFDSDPSCPGEGRVVKADGLPYHQCPAVVMVLDVSNISITTAAVTPRSGAAGVTKLVGRDPAASAAAEALKQQGERARPLQCDCKRASRSPGVADAPAGRPDSSSSSSSPTPATTAESGESGSRSQQQVSPSPAIGQPLAAGGSSNSNSSSSPAPAPGEGPRTAPQPQQASPSPANGQQQTPGGSSSSSGGSSPAPATRGSPRRSHAPQQGSPSPAVGALPLTPGNGNQASPSPSPTNEVGPGSPSLAPSPPPPGQAQQGTTACTASVALTRAGSGEPANAGLTVHAVWFITVNGTNTLNDKGAPLHNATAKTGARGIAVFTSPPINATAGYGCNITILQPADGTYELLVDRNRSKMWQHIGW